MMTEGQQRLVAVPWSGVKVFQDNAGNMTVSLTSRAAGEASPSAASNTPVNDDVLAAQQRLKARGYYWGAVDGVMGPNTEAGLRAYQRDNRLNVTGQLDAQTARALMNGTNLAARTDVRAAQRHLKEHGYYSGPVDGVIGPATEGAIRAYQRDRGLRVTGRLDSPTARSLAS
jgi:peptidoglycan hydrolase-like protein with peptidoglycan-binding domain